MTETSPTTFIPEETKETRPSKEITTLGKWVAGILLIFFSVASILFIVAYWPDRIPGSKDALKPLYINDAFHVRLAGIPDSICCVDSVYINYVKHRSALPDSTGRPDTSAAVKGAAPGKPAYWSTRPCMTDDLINLNTLLLALVAVAGFLGNMIHIATSFTTFVGADSFKRSWILWYCVRPFTASALAIALYFVFRGGFLNYNADSSGLNLYGVLTMAILAGLYTDKATAKLAEIFDVVFATKKDGKSADNRPDTLVPIQYKFDTVQPDKLSRTEPNVISITGDNFDKGKLSFSMNGDNIASDKITISSTKITIRYTIPDTATIVNAFTLTINGDQNKPVYTHTFNM